MDTPAVGLRLDRGLQSAAQRRIAVTAERSTSMRGGGAALTEMGTRVLKLYRQIEQEAAIATKSSCAELAKLLKA